MTSKEGPVTGLLMHFTYKVEMHLANSTLRDFLKDSGFFSDFEWGTTLWTPTF